MGLISKTVIVRWHNTTKRYYEELGYKFTKYGDEFEVKVKDLTNGSNSKVKYKCDECGAVMETTYRDYYTHKKDDGKYYCRLCGHRIFGIDNQKKSILNRTKSFKEWCIENNRQDVLDRWDYELNDCSPDEITYACDKKCWFKCDKHTEHKSELKQIYILTTNNNCKFMCMQCNSIAQWFIDNDLDINDYWDWDKNKDINIWDIAHSNNNKMVWMKCQNKDYHGSYSVRLNNFIKGRRCPYCINRKIHPKDSLGWYITDNYGEKFLWKLWSYKNDKTPFEYAPMSGKKIWWKCENDKHEEYFRSIQKSYHRGFRCPKCGKENKESVIEEKTRLYLESLGYTVLHEHNCTIVPQHPKNKSNMPFDNELVELKLIIEVHGEQHYGKISCKSTWLNGLTSEEHFHQRQLYDRYKKIYAIQNGYYYLEIPYTTFDSKDTYKKLIDDKINEILNKNY